MIMDHYLSVAKSPYKIWDIYLALPINDKTTSDPTEVKLVIVAGLFSEFFKGSPDYSKFNHKPMYFIVI
jgi:hypothetical protein